MSIVVFLGPSLPREKAEALLPEATFLPPAACGDVQRVLLDRPDIIALIDGVFERKPAVFHKELLAAIDSGVRLFGASSMGALRAAELHPFGMRGFGRVFEMYTTGELEDDDEVAVAHGTAEEDYRPYSEAMVNIRHGLLLARQAGRISPEAESAIAELAKARFYPERSWRTLFRDAERAGFAIEQLQSYIESEDPNLKRDDAVGLLRSISQQVEANSSPRSTFAFSATSYWRYAKDDVEHAARYDCRPSSPLPPRAYSLHAKLFEDPERKLNQQAVGYKLLDEVASLLGIEATPEEMARADSAISFPPETPPHARRARIRLKVLLRKVLQLSRTGTVDSYVPLALLDRGSLHTVIERVREKHEWLARKGLERVTFEDAGVEPEAVFEWYVNRYDAGETSPEKLAHELGLPESEIWAGLLADYLYNNRRDA